MLNTEEKIVRFYSAMTDVYRDEDDREMTGMPKMELSTDITDDVTAMLLAMHMIVHRPLAAMTILSTSPTGSTNLRSNISWLPKRKK